MDSTRILNSALETIHRTILKSSATESLPDLDLYRPLEIDMAPDEDSGLPEADAAVLQRIEIDEQDDQRSEPGLQSSIRHGTQQVATASAERARSHDRPESAEQTAAEEWFGDIAWSRDDDSKKEDAAMKGKSSTRRSGSDAAGQSTEEFFTGVDWDAESNEDQASSDLNMLEPSEMQRDQPEETSEDASRFFATTNWDGGGEQAVEGSDSDQREAEKKKSGEDAETFLGEMNWDGDGKSVSVNPDGEPPDHIKKISDKGRGAAQLPANEDAIERSRKEEKDKGEE